MKRRGVAIKSQMLAPAATSAADVDAIRAGIQAGLEKMAAETLAAARAMTPVRSSNIGTKPWSFGTIVRPSRKRLAEMSHPDEIKDQRVLVVADQGGETFAGVIVSRAALPRVQHKWARHAWEPDT